MREKRNSGREHGRVPSNLDREEETCGLIGIPNTYAAESRLQS
jgi:hypothetical protein